MHLISLILTESDSDSFKSDISKHFHPIAGRPLLSFVVDLAQQLSSVKPFIILDSIAIDNYSEVLQDKVHIIPRNTQKDCWQVLKNIYPNAQNANVLVLHADMPLLQLSTLQELIEHHASNKKDISFLVEKKEMPVDDDSAKIDGPVRFLPFIISPVILHADNMNLVNGLCAMDLKNSEFQKITNQYDTSIQHIIPDDSRELLFIQTKADYSIAISIIQQRINNSFMLSGVSILNPNTVYIDYNIKIGRDTVIYPNTIITGTSIIGNHSQIGPNTIIDNCTIGDRCRVFASVVESAVMENDSDIGPFSHLRKGAYVCEFAHVGNYGELKNAKLGTGAKMGHFSYLGDTEVGAEANIGAGTITCNFDGITKHRTRIGDNAFIGSGTMIVAPAEIGKNAITGAGSVVTHDIPDNALAYGVPARIKKDTPE
jgi:bifunctional UDP-N-acetylglucosamine pyrophosphorylase/glucosamine-1-phosphate N-acetyltransferase